MRLNTEELNAITEAVCKRDEEAKIYLFGSRVDDTKRGGDIDLLIFSHHLEYMDGLSIRRRICDKIGEQKIDILIAKDTSDPFVRVALEQSILIYSKE